MSHKIGTLPDNEVLHLMLLLTRMELYTPDRLLAINPHLDLLELSMDQVIQINGLLEEFNHGLLDDDRPSLGDYVLGDAPVQEHSLISWPTFQVAANFIHLPSAWTVNTPAGLHPAEQWLVQLNKSPLPQDPDEYSLVLQSFVFMAEPLPVKARDLERVGYVRRQIKIDNFPDSAGTVRFYVPVKVWRFKTEQVPAF